MSKLISFYCLLLIIQSCITTAFVLSTPSTTSFPFSSSINKNNDDFVVVVGKIIIDDYRAPTTSLSSVNDDHDGRRPKSKIIIGGGGPQAAWGAAAALAVIQTFSNNNNDYSTLLLNHNEKDQDQSTMSSSLVPPKQNVTFLGPIGKFSKEEYESLQETLGPAIETIKLIQIDNDASSSSSSLETPRIQLWHNTKQEIQWKPIGDTWGDNGADSLWRNRPSANDILLLLNNNKKSISNLHVIIEVGATSPGNGDDSLLLSDDRLIENVNYIGIEPIAFPIEDEKGDTVISKQDSISAKERISKFIDDINIIVPDSHLAEALEVFWKDNNSNVEMVARYGPEGSRIMHDNNNKKNMQQSIIPVISLETNNGQPINPTGAGNAYSAALSTCRSKGLSIYESACIATAIGGVVCEYDHLPPWTWNVIERIRRGVSEVLEKSKEIIVV